MAHFLRLSVLMLLSVTAVAAQDAAAIEQRIEALRQQLLDVSDQQARLQTRREQLEESLRPEEIAKSVAGTGTTDAAALREQRRQQLERERSNVDGQLSSLDASRARLESAIANAEAEVVRLKAASLAPRPASQEAAPSAAPLPAPAATPPAVRRRAPAKRRPTARRRNRQRRQT